MKNKKSDQTTYIGIILASASPRRKMLLQQAGLEFKIVTSGIEELQADGDIPGKYAAGLSRAKALAVCENFENAWVIGADSIVVIDGQILEKPDDRVHAKQMLSMLSGRTHIVITGYTIACHARNHLFTDIVETGVTFKKLNKAEIDWYTRTPEPYDKAGGYAIQGTGAFIVKSISGSYTNVVGLPVCEVVEHLYANGVVDRD
ncbi:MAG: septum formation inhibitor Maf [Deltaproteobacteria bacterium]|nr:septum formation inhibitor Maf [Deltaproteobacteria bacterium]